ncbi:MAG: hypothetical protein DCC68_19915 [Planctomycetota bacterium]|nr:MAG: hypothetical protein DCC68_19915 [Planctomycetota bacterium]
MLNVRSRAVFAVPCFPLIAVDVGNSRTKLGFFGAAPAGDGLPIPAETLDLSGSNWPVEALRSWLAALPRAAWRVASVNRPAAQRLEAAIAEICPEAERYRVAWPDLPLMVNVPHPERVGIDRLLGAVAANRLRHPNRAAVVIHVGTAITVNLVTPDGAFAGGAILPGIALSAQALHDHTDLLPRIEMVELADAPPVVGATTEWAIASGLFWGAVGAMRELAARLGAAGTTSRGDADIILTGGAAESVAQLLGPNVRHEPHLVLAGIPVAASASDEKHAGVEV